MGFGNSDSSGDCARGSHQVKGNMVVIRISAFFAVLVLSLATSVHAQTSLSDGGFDDQGAAVEQYCYDCPAGEWQFASGAGLIRAGNIDWPSPIPQSPPIVAFIQSTGVIRRSITSTADGSVRFGFKVAGRSNQYAGGNQTVYVWANGLMIGSAQTFSGQTWTSYVTDAVHVASGQTIDLQIIGTATSDQTMFIDDIEAIAAVGSSKGLLDGGFDERGATVAQYCYQCPAGPWLFDKSSGLVRNGNIDWPAPVPPSLPVVAFIQGSGQFEQKFVAKESGPSRVAFLVTGRKGFPQVGGNQTIDVFINGVELGSVQTASDQDWLPFVSEAFPAVIGQSYVLTIAGAAIDDQTAFIDDVRIIVGTSVAQFSYDALGRLVEAQGSVSTVTNFGRAYCYDAVGNRTQVLSNSAESVDDC